MSVRIDLPPFDIVSMEDASNLVAKRLRVYVAVQPEDVDRIAQVATGIVDDHASNNDVVFMFFHFSAEAAGKTPAEARAQYIRNGMKQGYVPAPLKSDRGVYKVKMPNGVVTVEAARQHEEQAPVA